MRGGWAMAFQRPGMSDFTGVFGDNQGIPATLQSDQNNATRCRSCCATIRRCPAAPRCRCRRRRRRSPRAATPYDPDIQLPYIAVVVGGLAAQGHARLGDRAALCRQQARERLGFDQPQRAQHHQQRLPQRVPSGAGQPAGQHRRRPRRDVRLHRRRHGTPLPIFLAHFNAQNAANAGNAAAYSGAQLDQRDVPRLPRRAQSESVGLRDGWAPAA